MRSHAGVAFILVHHATPNPCFRLKGYASSSHRLDIAARVIKASFCTAEGIRDDVRVYVYMADTGIVLEFLPEHARCAEKDIMRGIRGKLCKGEYMVLNPPGGIATLVEEFSPDTTIILEEGGSDISSLSSLLSKRAAVLLGGREDIPSEMLSGLEAERISIGPLSYLASHAVSFVLSIVDSL